MALGKKCLFKNGHTLFLLLIVLISLFCNQDYNPFTDPSNANVYITSCTFSEKDSIALFETGTFTTVVAVPELVDSFIFVTPNNRFGTDTIVRIAEDYRNSKKVLYTFEVSYFDTGLQTSTLMVFRSGLQPVEHKFQIRVYNPLWQDDIKAYFGDTLTFLTNGVPDEEAGVLYHWSLEGNWNGSSVSSRFPAVISLFSPSYGDGSLWVSDVSENNKSPAVTFSYTFEDISKPVIRCTNEGLVVDTIFTGDTLFAFKAFISDAGIAEVESCSVNRTAFDFFNSSTSVYTKLFEDLPAISPLALYVFALDNLQFKNTAADTFYVVYDESAVISSPITVFFTHPSLNSVITSQQNYHIFGTAWSNHNDTFQLSCTVNGNVYSSQQSINGTGKWDWIITFDSTYNDITVDALNGNGETVSSAHCVIIYDENAVDTTKPVIAEISTGGKSLGSLFYTDNNSLTLKIIAFDDGSGLDFLTVNNDTLYADSTVLMWNVSQLEHKEGNLFHFVAVDKSNNKTERTVIIYRNSPPELQSDIGIPKQCCAESTYTDTLYWKDQDNDPIELKSIKVPEGMTITREGYIDWSPSITDGNSREDTLIIELSDSYEKKLIQWIFTSKKCSESATSITFSTTEEQFPEILQAGFDRLTLRLTINSSGLTSKPRYSAVFLDNGNRLLDNDTSGVILWAPSQADTGYRKLMVTVGDGSRGYDTLYPSMLVVPKNQYACSLSVVFSGDTTPTGVLDLFTHPEPETLFFAIHDSDHYATEMYTTTVSLGPLRSIETLNKKDFHIIIEPDSLRQVELLDVKVNDKTGTSDSVHYIIQYASSTVNIRPIVSQDPLFPPFCCVDSFYNFQFTIFDPNGDSVEVVTLYAPQGMTISDSGLIEWNTSLAALGDDSIVIRLYDQQDSSDIYRWFVTVLDCDNLPPAVSFKTDSSDFPTLLQADIDSIAFQLEIEDETGMPPFTFNAQLDNGLEILKNDTTGYLYWIPTSSDTGVRTMIVSVNDFYKTTDTLSIQFNVIPRNHYPCFLSYTYSGITLPSGVLSLFSTTQPESALFVISDQDHPITERYNVTIDKGSSTPTTLHLSGEDSTFSVAIEVGNSRYQYPSYYQTPTSDTIVVSVNDSTGTTDTVRLYIRYPIESPDDIAELSLSLSASENVTTQYMYSRVSRWSYGSSYYNSISFSQTDYDRQPTLDNNAANGKPAIFFNHSSGSSNDGLFNNSYSNWADDPFTVFIVFSLRSFETQGRQTLISTNRRDGFGLGITCENTIGIINNVDQTNCLESEWDGTDLAVERETWYIVTYQSSLGIPIDGNIRVAAWLNGTAASEDMELSTQNGSGMVIGTGSSYDGSLDGWIASIIIYKRALSEDERFLMEQYLGNIYDIALE